MIAITNATHAIPEFCNTNNSILLSSLEPEKMSTEIANAMNQRNLQEISKNGSKRFTIGWENKTPFQEKLT